MMTQQNEAAGTSTEFSPTELAALRERRERLSNEWVSTVRAEADRGEDGKVTLDSGISAEAQETIRRIQAEYEVVSATVKEHERAREQAALVKAGEELTATAPRYRDLQAKAEAKFYDDILAVGQNRYRNDDPDADRRGGAHPGSIAVPQPLIAENSTTGKNEVHPFNAVFAGDGGNRQASIEASFRNAEMIAADRFREFDPVSGQRRGAHERPVGKQLEAELGFGIAETVADVYLRQGGALYQYEIQRNELVQYMNMVQLPAVNDYIIDRRTSIGSGTLVQRLTEAGAMTVVDSEFDSLTFTPKKVGFLRGMTYESSQLMEPWSVVNTIMTDAGIAMGNYFGEQVVIGNSTDPGGAMNTQLTGLLPWAKTSGNANNHALGAQATFLSTTGNTFGIDAMSRFMTSLPKEYFRSPGKLLSMSLASWGKFNGVVDGENRKLFDSNSSLHDMGLPDWNTRVVIDENWDDASAANEVPFFYGDFKCATFIMYGPVRVDYSAEHGFTTDRYYWRFIAHRGFGVVDPNGMRGGRVT